MRRLSLAIAILLCLVVGLTVSAQQPTPSGGVPIEFDGNVEATDGSTIVVDQLTIDVSQVQVAQPLTPGQTITVIGVLQPDGTIQAQQIITQATSVPPTPLPANTTPVATAPVALNECPLGQGYWKNHPEEWTDVTLTLGSQTYTQEELLTLLNTPVEGDASLNLAHQLIATLLSVQNGSDPAQVSPVIQSAQTIFASNANKLPYRVDTASDLGQQMVAAAGTLDVYNRRQLTPACDTDVMITTVEGPITNLDPATGTLTVFGFIIQLPPNDPRFQQFQPGMIVRIDGEVLPNAGNILLLALDIQIADEVIIIDGGNEGGSNRGSGRGSQKSQKSEKKSKKS